MMNIGRTHINVICMKVKNKIIERRYVFMKTKSIWGNPPTRLYNLIKIAENNWHKDFTACVVGCSDGKFLMPFARKGIHVTGYDIDEIALYGGSKLFPIVRKKVKYKYSKDFKSKDYKLEERKVVGILDRLKEESLQNFAKIERRDFYKDVPMEKFNVVFTSCSLHYSVNKDFSLEDKMSKLQSIVLPNGYLYVDYMMAIDEEDYGLYPNSKFFRKREILNYFDDSWKIISLKENNSPTFEGAHVDCVKDHFHRFGYILAKRLK